jgi:hypothetical protein
LEDLGTDDNIKKTYSRNRMGAWIVSVWHGIGTNVRQRVKKSLASMIQGIS